MGRFFYVSSDNFGNKSKAVARLLVTGVENGQETILTYTLVYFCLSTYLIISLNP